MVDSVEIFLFQSVLFLQPALPASGFSYCKYIKIKTTESYIIDKQFGDNTIQRWKLPNSLVQESYSYKCKERVVPLGDSHHFSLYS